MWRDVVTRDLLLSSHIGIVRVAEERHRCGLRVPDAHQSEPVALCCMRCCARALIEQSLIDVA